MLTSSLCDQDIAHKKAKTTALFGAMPSSVFLNISEPGGAAYGLEMTNGGTVVFGGGQPIFDPNGYFIGAVGVSGGSGTEDVDVAVHAAQAVGTTVTGS
jgi:uncharacterized protein GlcG (DUF336 family)